MLKKRIISILFMLALVGTTGVVVYKVSTTSEYEKNVNKIVEMSEEERQAQLDKIVEDGMMNVQYTPNINVKGWTSENFNIKNIDNNKNPIKFSIIEEDGSVIYESDRIDLGYELNGLEFTKKLESGVHNCRICIGYDAEGNVSSSFPITINVQ